MKIKNLSLLVILTASSMLIGCSSSTLDGNVYSANQAKTIRAVSYGTVQAVSPIEINSQTNNTGINFGSIAGGVLGGLIGNTIGGGHGKTISTAVGAIGGALAGNAVNSATQNSNGVQLTILPDGVKKPIVIVQGGNPAQFYVGQRVQIIGNSGSDVQVSPLSSTQ